MMKKTLLFTLFAFLLCITYARGQSGVVTYDFRDGTIIAAGQSTDGTLTLSGTYSLHGSTYGLNMKVGGEIQITVPGSCTLRFLGSVHSGLNMMGTALTEGDLGTQVTKVTNDLSDFYDFVYQGAAATLVFKLVAGTGNDLYLPKIDLIPSQAGGDVALSAAGKNIIYYFDLRDGSIIPTTPDGTSTIEQGLFKLEKLGTGNYGYHGTDHGSTLRVGNRITLKVAGNSYIKIGGCQYSNNTSTVTVSSTTGDFDVDSKTTQTASCYHNTGITIDFLYVGTEGTVVLDFAGGTTYIPIIFVVPVPYPVTLENYVQKSGTITINGITINLSSGATATDPATLSVSEGIVLSSTAEEGYIALNLGGNAISTFTPTYTGDIGSVSTTDGKLTITYSDQSTTPKTYSIELYDNSYLHGITTYDFRDGTIITNQQSTDGFLTLGGAYSYHGGLYGMDMKVNQQINVTVSESKSFKFLGSVYSGLNMVGTAVTEGDLGTQVTKVTNDLSDTYDYVYDGNGGTLNFKTVAGTGNDVYLPKIDLYPAQFGAAYASAIKDIIYYFDFRDGSIVPTSTTGNTTISKGLVTITPGSSNAYGYNGNQHGSIFKEGNQITLQVAGNSYIKIGGCRYSNGTISVSSATGSFEKVSQSSLTTACYHEDGTTIDFLYVGTTGTVTLDFTGTNYIPLINVIPVPYDVELQSWVQKSGTIALNGVDISLTSGENSSANATVTVSEGTVVSATVDEASIRINLGGNALSSFTPTFTGDIASVTVDTDSLLVTYADETTLPQSYKIVVADNSTTTEAEPGKTYTYNFANGSVLPQTSYTALRYLTFTTSDGLLTINSNTTTTSMQFGYHDSSHGAVLFPGNSFDITVAGNATVTFGTCQYGSALDAIFEFTDSEGTVLGSCGAISRPETACGTKSFSYTGAKGVITATLKSPSYPNAEVYIHYLSVENAAYVEPSNGKIDVWDFGAAQLDEELYNNKLDSATINSWYATSITPGTSGNVLPSAFSAGQLSWVGGSNDRLRTTNTKLTRYDENIASVTGYTGRVYVNSAANTGRYMSLTLSENDEVTIIEKTDAGGRINFQNVADPEAQTDVVTVTSNLDTLKFVAKTAGTYHIFDDQGKPSYYRIYRKDATYVTITGTVDASAASGIPEGYGIVFTNESGKTWTSIVSENSYTAQIPAGYTYTLSLSGANGYVISNGTSLEVTEATTTHDIVIERIELYTVSGSISGLDAENLAKLTLVYTPDPAANKIFVPDPIIDVNAATYSVELEPNCLYTISANGVNDYNLVSTSITIGNENTTANIEFTAKPVYNVATNVTGLTEAQLALLNLTFTNLNETGYSYNFILSNGITLRDGTYSITYSGLEQYPVDMKITSNLTVSGADVSKTIEFNPVSTWSFDDRDIVNSAYKGMLFTGTVTMDLYKGHLTSKSGATIQVPVNVGDKVKVTYYYTAAFNFEGGETISTASNSTSLFEFAEYIYTGTEAGYVTINILEETGTTYFPEVSVCQAKEYRATLYVGTDKEFTTINDALVEVPKMTRTSDQRVTIVIDPGNYEEMLVVTEPNITLKNASSSPSTDIYNKGVDIEANAVRITSYYGHGYNYYSMKNNQKWDADVLRVNKENGYYSYTNKGSGTSNGSYWNSTVVVSGSGFEAEDIIFENSFNQYISRKESEDVVVMWETGSKGQRPTTIGSTDVQNRSYVERACALAITNNVDKVVLTKCRIIGRQDAFYGGTGVRAAIIKGAVMGAVDYIFGGMTAVFYKTDLVLNTSDVTDDAAYITAAQQSSGRGYLMYKCTVKSTIPGIETASAFVSKPGYFGRPWTATTSEVVFYNTTVDTSYFTGYEGKSLISPAGWSNSLSGESNKMYEYGTIERSGENNSSSRVSWSTVLTEPTLTDGTAITTFNFTKGTDNWDPIPVEEDALAVSSNTLTVAAPANSTKTFDITSNVSWKVTSDQSWLTVSKAAGFDNATITLTAAENTITSVRTATVTVSGSGVTTQTITVTQDASATGINEVNENSLNIFPNPAIDLVNIQRESSKPEMLIIMDLTGKKLFEKQLHSSKESVDISSLPSGLYIINVGTSKGKLLVK